MDAPLLALSRGLSPACCKVLIALMMAGSALDVAALETWTGLGRKVLGQALAVLKGLSLVVPQAGAHNRQVWLPVGDSLFLAFQLGQNDSTEPLTTTTTIEARARSKVVIERQLRQNDAAGIGQPHWDPAFAANLAACQQFGITEPVASELAAREWVDPGYIQAHMLGLDDWDTRGLAVVRMRAGEEPPGSPVPKVSRKRQVSSTPAFGTVSQTRSPADAPASELMDGGDARGQARQVLLQAAGLAALPPSEYARLDQVGTMLAAYGAEETLAELQAQRDTWCSTRGRNGRLYSALHMGWVDRADEALSGNGPPPEPEGPISEPPPPSDYPDTVPMPPGMRRPVIKPLPTVRAGSTPVRDGKLPLPPSGALRGLRRATAQDESTSR